MNKPAKIIFLLFLSTFASHLRSFPVGIKLGFSASSFRYSNSVMEPYLGFDIDLRPYLGYDIKWVQLGAQKPLLAPAFSCFYDYEFADRFFLRPEVGITQKGVVFNQYDYERIIYEVKITYVRFPLTFGYQLINKDHFILDLYTGGAGALKLDAYKKVGYHNSPAKRHTLDNVGDYDFSVLAGFDIKWQFKNQYFIFDVQSCFGLTDIFHPIENQAQLYHQTKKIKNTGFFLSLGYEFTR